MSEYQYYEFAALDHVLDRRQQSELRAISTRALITPTSFVNTYEWGDLKADPRRLVERYFDAFLYVSNWGTRRLMLRLPAAALGAHSVGRYCIGDSATAWSSGEHLIIDLVTEDEDGAFEEDWSYGGGEGRVSSIVPARADLASSDRRLLYLAWLLCVQAGEVPGDEAEPPVPTALGRLKGSLQGLAEFLRIDPDLLAVAASADTDPDYPLGALAEWLAMIPEAEKDTVLLRVAQGDGQRMQAELVARLRQAVPAVDQQSSGRRTVDELLALAAARRDERQRRARQQRERQAAERERAVAAARAKRLAELAARQQQAWREVDELIQARKPADYDVAVALLQDLDEICRREHQTATYQQRVLQLRQMHRRKTSFIERLERHIERPTDQRHSGPAAPRDTLELPNGLHQHSGRPSSAEREELRQLVEQLPDSQLPGRAR